MSDFRKANVPHLLEGIPHPAILLDEGFVIRYLNRRAQVLTGRSAEESRGVQADNILRGNLPVSQLADGSVPAGDYTGDGSGPAGDYTGDGSGPAGADTGLPAARMVSREGNILDRNRHIIPVRFSLSSLDDEEGRAIGSMLIIEDLSLLAQAQRSTAAREGLDGVVSISRRMREVTEQIPVFAATDASVLIDGETGTGKGMVAELIHNASKRSGFPFVKVNCGALPPQLLESELFGHVRGAFPGADRDKPGMFRLADRGTIFFTEIGDLPLPLQAKLLTVLDDGVFTAVGSTVKIAMNVRVIAATGRDLKPLVASGRFREDLFYRLKVLQLHLPPLRERVEDVPLLIDHFIKTFSAGMGAPQIDPQVITVLKEYSYPGNVRELRNIIEHALALSHGETIRLEHLPEYVLSGEGEAGQPAAWQPPAAGLGAEAGADMKWDDVEKQMIIDALRHTRGKRSEAAKQLGWARSTLYRKLKYHGI